MAPWMTDAVGAAAAVCSMTSFTPQLIKIWRERHADDVSLRMYLVTVTGFTLWTVYGLLLGRWPLVASNLVSLGLAAAILVLKLRFSKGKGRGGEPPRPISSR